MSRPQPALTPQAASGARADARALAAKVYERHGIALHDDDPAFALVTLNELTLRKAMADLLGQVDQRIKSELSQFQLSMERLEVRGGKMLAQQVRDSASVMQGTLREETTAAHLGLQEMVAEIRKTYRFATLVRWCVVGAIVAVAMFACGFWAGKL